MMGMGEPFQNYEATMRMVRILHEEEGMNFGARRITVSTSGLVPFIDRLAREPFQVKLAVSLHAPNDDLRSSLVPLNRRYPIGELIAACRRYVGETGRRVTFEYVLIDGVNDRRERRSRPLLRGLLCHVNLIPWNPTPAAPLPGVEPHQPLRDPARPASATVSHSRGVTFLPPAQLRASGGGGRVSRRRP